MPLIDFPVRSVVNMSVAVILASLVSLSNVWAFGQVPEIPETWRGKRVWIKSGLIWSQG